MVSSCFDAGWRFLGRVRDVQGDEKGARGHEREHGIHVLRRKVLGKEIVVFLLAANFQELSGVTC